MQMGGSGAKTVTKPVWESSPSLPGGAPADLSQTARLAQLGLMAGELIHEMRQPLLGIKGYCQVLAEGASGEAKERAQQILKQAERLEELIERYRRFLRSEPAETRLVNVGEALREALKIIEPRLRAGGIEVASRVGDDLPQVKVAEGQLTQIAVNLVSNACDAVTQDPAARVDIQLGCLGS